MVMRNCESMGLDVVHKAEDLLSGNKRLNQILVAQLFWNNHGLVLSDADDIDSGPEDYEDRDEGSREERTFR